MAIHLHDSQQKCDWTKHNQVVNELDVRLEMPYTRSSIITGLALTTGAARKIKWATGDAIVAGTKYSPAASSGVGTDNAFNWVYLNSSGVVSVATTKPSGNYAMVGVAQASGNAVIKARNLRMRFPDLDGAGNCTIEGDYKFKSGTSFTGTLAHNIGANRTWTLPDVTGTVALLEQTNIFTAAQRINAGLGVNVAPPATGDIQCSGDLTVGDQLIVSGVGPHAIGGATAASVQLYLRGTYAADQGVFVGNRIQPAVNTNGDLVFIQGTIDEGASGTHTRFSSLAVDAPSITAGVATLTNAVSLYIQAAPTGATNNYALWVDAGVSRFDGNIGESANRVPGVFFGTAGLDGTGPIVTTSVGPHAIGGATNADAQLRQTGSFTGSVVSRGFALDSSLTGVVNGGITGIDIFPTFVEAASGTHTSIIGIDIRPGITAGVATTTDFFGIRVQSTTTASGTTTATGLSVAAPTGATNNYAAVFTGGNVGIGTTAPGALLQVGGLGVAGIAAPTQLRLDGSFANTNTPSNQQLKLNLINASATEAYGLTVSSNSGMWYHSGDSATTAGYHAFATSGAARVRITGDGNVGIATTLPSTLLHVGLAGTTLGTIGIAGNTSGLVTLSVAAAAGTWTMKLPTAVGAAGQQLTDAAGDGVTSWAAAASRREWKDILREWTDPQVALDRMLATKVYDFRYRADSPNTGDIDTVYTGVMSDEAPWAMHHQGSIVNPVNSLGYSILAIQALQAQFARYRRALVSLGVDPDVY